MRNLLFPTTCGELFGLLQELPQCRLMAGGTDLLVALRSLPADDRPLVCLERVAELSEISATADGGVSIGACATFGRIMTAPLLTGRYPLLTQAAATVGGPAIRNMATIGGNIATASPAADSLPPLYLLDVAVEIRAAAGSRTVPIAEFILGPRKTLLRSGEIISRVILPPAGGGDIQRFEKVGRRRSLAIAVASLASMIRLEGDCVVEARLAWGSVGPTVLRSPAAEQALIGRPLSAASLAVAAGHAHEAVRPIDDLRASAQYRRSVAGNLLLRLCGTEADRCEARPREVTRA